MCMKHECVLRKTIIVQLTSRCEKTSVLKCKQKLDYRTEQELSLEYQLKRQIIHISGNVSHRHFGQTFPAQRAEEEGLGADDYHRHPELMFSPRSICWLVGFSGNNSWILMKRYGHFW